MIMHLLEWVICEAATLCPLSWLMSTRFPTQYYRPLILSKLLFHFSFIQSSRQCYQALHSADENSIMASDMEKSEHKQIKEKVTDSWLAYKKLFVCLHPDMRTLQIVCVIKHWVTESWSSWCGWLCWLMGSHHIIYQGRTFTSWH